MKTFVEYLQETILLIEGKVEKLEAKHPDVPVRKYAELDTTPTKKFLDWLVKQHLKGNITPDTPNLKDILQGIEKYRHLHDIKDHTPLDYYQVRDLVEPHLGKLLGKAAKQQQIETGVEQVYSGPKGIKAYHIKTKDASQMLYGGGIESGGNRGLRGAVGTDWCVSARSKLCLFRKGYGLMYTIHVPGDENSPYAVHPEEETITTRHNDGDKSYKNVIKQNPHLEQPYNAIVKHYTKINEYIMNTWFLPENWEDAAGWVRDRDILHGFNEYPSQILNIVKFIVTYNKQYGLLTLFGNMSDETLSDVTVEIMKAVHSSSDLELLEFFTEYFIFDFLGKLQTKDAILRLIGQIKQKHPTNEIVKRVYDQIEAVCVFDKWYLPENWDKVHQYVSDRQIAHSLEEESNLQVIENIISFVIEYNRLDNVLLYYIDDSGLTIKVAFDILSIVQSNSNLDLLKFFTGEYIQKIETSIQGNDLELMYQLLTSARQKHPEDRNVLRLLLPIKKSYIADRWFIPKYWEEMHQHVTDDQILLRLSSKNNLSVVEYAAEFAIKYNRINKQLVNQTGMSMWSDITKNILQLVEEKSKSNLLKIFNAEYLKVEIVSSRMKKIIDALEQSAIIPQIDEELVERVFKYSETSIVTKFLSLLHTKGLLTPHIVELSKKYGDDGGSFYDRLKEMIS